MPIRFRCSYCNRLLGIARRKAGTDTTCPHCGYEITVPTPDGPDDDFDDVEAHLKASPPPAPAPVPVSKPPMPPAPVRPAPLPRPAPAALPDGERPLFEADVDELLGPTYKPAPAAPKPQPLPTQGVDVMSLGSGGDQIVMSPQKATALIAAVVVMLLVAFVAGFLIASK